MKDALGHGSDPQGVGSGPDPRGLRSGIKIASGAQFSGAKLGTYAPSSAGQALVDNIRGGVKPVAEVHPSFSMSVRDRKKFGPFADIIANYRANGGKPPANKGQLKRIARFRKAVGRGE